MDVKKKKKAILKTQWEFKHAPPEQTELTPHF